jgi:hypothetical protein
VPLGINIAEQGARLGVSPHTQWHWGPEARWTSWAPLGGIGRIWYRPPRADRVASVLR